MDWAYLHAIGNHFPIILTVVGTVAVIYGALSSRRGVWLYALATLTLAGVSVYPAFLSGGRAEDAMENKWYIVKSMIGAHEEAADVALWVVLATGALSAYSWWRLMRTDRATLLPNWLRAAVVVGALASTGTIGYASFLGGKIVHESPKLLTGDSTIRTRDSALRLQAP